MKDSKCILYEQLIDGGRTVTFCKFAEGGYDIEIRSCDCNDVWLPEPEWAQTYSSHDMVKYVVQCDEKHGRNLNRYEREELFSILYLRRKYATLIHEPKIAIFRLARYAQTIGDSELLGWLRYELVGLAQLRNEVIRHEPEIPQDFVDLLKPIAPDFDKDPDSYYAMLLVMKWNQRFLRRLKGHTLREATDIENLVQEDGNEYEEAEFFRFYMGY